MSVPKHQNFSIVQCQNRVPNHYLSDSCFAYIDKDGTRWLPHHYPDGTLDMPHLRAAIVAVKTSWQNHPDYQRVLNHLEQHQFEPPDNWGRCIDCIAYPCNVIEINHLNINEYHWCAGFQLPIYSIVRKMDDAFLKEIIKTERVWGEFEIKSHGFEYRSLPTTISLEKVVNTAFKILWETMLL